MTTSCMIWAAHAAVASIAVAISTTGAMLQWEVAGGRSAATCERAV
jgi:hypothetical protein